MDIELNKKQIEAFKELEKAFKKCKTAKILFYAVIGDLKAVNGNYIKEIEVGEWYNRDSPLLMDIVNLGLIPNISYPSEFADDEGSHRAVLTEKGIKKLAKEKDKL